MKELIVLFVFGVGVVFVLYQMAISVKYVFIKIHIRYLKSQIKRMKARLSIKSFTTSSGQSFMFPERDYYTA